jgi:hypothetical protein
VRGGNAGLRPPLDTPHLAIAPHVTKAIAPLFAVFGGYELPPQAIEEAVRQSIERRLPG